MARLSENLEEMLSKVNEQGVMKNILTTAIEQAKNLEGTVKMLSNAKADQEKQDLIKLIPHANSLFRTKIEDRIAELFGLGNIDHLIRLEKHTYEGLLYDRKILKVTEEFKTNIHTGLVKNAGPDAPDRGPLVGVITGAIDKYQRATAELEKPPEEIPY